MANVVAPTALKMFLDADIDLLVDTIRVALCDAADVAYNSAHDYYDDISAAVVGGALSTNPALGTKTTTAGVFDAADTTWTALTGDQCEYIWIYKDTGTAATSPLICGMDTFASGMPITPNGGDFKMQWNASGIFSI